MTIKTLKFEFIDFNKKIISNSIIFRSKFYKKFNDQGLSNDTKCMEGGVWFGRSPHGKQNKQTTFFST